MNSQVEIFNKIKEALITSCSDALYFSDNETHLIDAEYLVTVNTAKAIKELNNYFGTPYKIYLEHDTKNFSTACTPLIGKKLANNFMGYSSVLRSKNNTERTGKIDIAIYKTYNSIDIPLCAIEIKGFNPSKKNIIEDLKRNAEYFMFTSPTGASQLSFTIFIALHSYKNTLSDKKCEMNIGKVRKRYERYIKEIELLSKLNHTIDLFTIRRGVVPAPSDPYIKEMGLEGNEDYHFIGAILLTCKESKEEESINRNKKSY